MSLDLAKLTDAIGATSSALQKLVDLTEVHAQAASAAAEAQPHVDYLTDYVLKLNETVIAQIERLNGGKTPEAMATVQAENGPAPTA